MHLERIFIDHTKNVSCAGLNFAADPNSIRKWTLLPPHAQNLELFALFALACSRTQQAPQLRRLLPSIVSEGVGPVHVEFVLVRHAPQECGPFQPPRKGSGWQILFDGSIVPIQKDDARHLHTEPAFGKPHLGSGNAGWLFLAYGRQVLAPANTDSLDLQVNFNQTLDLRLVTAEKAALLRRIRCSNVRFTRRNYYFSLNNSRFLDFVRNRYQLLQVTPRDNVEFVCMYGFDTTLAEDVERFQFLRSLPGAYVFLQRYRPVLGGPEADPSRFFDDRSDEQIDALLRVNFTQNMKSMEVYYRWLCLLYAQRRGRVHQRLVETLFRYNKRHLMGGFLAKLDKVVLALAHYS